MVFPVNIPARSPGLKALCFGDMGWGGGGGGAVAGIADTACAKSEDS